MIRLRHITPLIAIGAAGTAAAAPDTEMVAARAFIDQVYRPYLSPTARQRPVDQRGILGVEPLRLITRDRKQSEGEIGIVDSDPLCECQDTARFSYKVVNLQNSAQGWLADIAITNGGERHTTTLVLRRNEQRRFVISNIISQTYQPSFNAWLSGMLARSR